MENSIQKARTHFEDKEYLPALGMCLELIKAGTDKKDAFLLAAKSFLFTTKTPMDKDKISTVLNTFENACAEAKTIEEALEIERDMTATIYAWQAETIKAQLADLEKNPTLEQWKNYYSTLPEYIELILFVQLHTRNCQVTNAYCEEKGIEKKELGNKLKEEYGDRFKVSKVITNEEISSLEYETAQRVFRNIQAILSKNNDGNVEFLKRLSLVAIKGLTTAEQIAQHALPQKGQNPDVRCERLMLVAEIITYKLSAKIYPNGIPMSLFSGEGRVNEVNALKRIYAEIQELDSSFEVPKIPNAEEIKPTAQASGGCYVDTAVYGSYDCPEVWTLRRFRDNTLAETWHGRAFIRTYYAISPTLVKWFGNTNWFKNIWKPTLDKLVKKLNTSGVENTPYNDYVW